MPGCDYPYEARFHSDEARRLHQTVLVGDPKPINVPVPVLVVAVQTGLETTADSAFGGRTRPYKGRLSRIMSFCNKTLLPLEQNMAYSQGRSQQCFHEGFALG